MSRTGMPSVMQTMSGSSAAAASRIASAANAGGTKMQLAFAPVSRTASAIVLNTGTPKCVEPPLPGVTPATTLVPYSSICSVWKPPSLPVIPWTTRRVFLSTKTLIKIAVFCGMNSARTSMLASQSTKIRRWSSCLVLLVLFQFVNFAQAGPIFPSRGVLIRPRWTIGPGANQGAAALGKSGFFGGISRGFGSSGERFAWQIDIAALVELYRWDENLSLIGVGAQELH